jgi:hypothetical protein
MKTDFLIAEYDGESFVPLRRYEKHCDENYVVGEKYRFTIQEERSIASHNQYFAAIHDMWLSLPEVFDGRFPTEEHLRKFALIMTGHRDEQSFTCGSNAEAQRFAAFLKPIDDYAVIDVTNSVVTRLTAKSQSIKAMGRKDFQISKQAVLDYISGMLGISTQKVAA